MQIEHNFPSKNNPFCKRVQLNYLYLADTPLSCSYAFIDASEISRVFKAVCDKYKTSLNNIMVPILKSLAHSNNNSTGWLITLSVGRFDLLGYLLTVNYP